MVLANPLEQYLFLAIALLGIIGAVYALKNRSSKKFPLFILASFILIALGAWGSFSFQPPQVTALQETGGTRLPESGGGFAEGVGEAQLLSTESQVFTQTIQPLVCDQGNLVYWRELRVYNVTKQNKTKTLSTITLFVKNAGENAVKNVLVKEKLPEEVAKTPEEIVGFSITPFAFERGSVVVNWLFENIEPGETKSVSYTVEKQVGEGVLNEFEAPQVVSQTTGQAVAQPTQPAQQAADYTLVGLVLVAVILGAVIVFFLRRE